MSMARVATGTGDGVLWCRSPFLRPSVSRLYRLHSITGGGQVQTAQFRYLGRPRRLEHALLPQCGQLALDNIAEPSPGRLFLFTLSSATAGRLLLSC